MFGLIFIVTTVTWYIATALIHAHEEREAYKRTYNPKTDTYHDSQGRTFSARTGGHAFITWENGDTVVKDLHLRTINNPDEEERIKKFNEMEANHPDTITTWEYPYRNEFKNVEGTKYKDFKTGDIYVVRKLYVKDMGLTSIYPFYMNVKTGMLVRLTDDQKYKMNTVEKLCIPLDIAEKFIKEFNEEQSNKDKNSYWYSESSYFYNNPNQSGYDHSETLDRFLEKKLYR